MENLVNRKIRGFKYSIATLPYHKAMDKYIGKIGVIEQEASKVVLVRFADDLWCYPIDEAIKHLVEEEPKLGENSMLKVENKPFFDGAEFVNKKETPEEKVDRLTKELEQAKKELKTKVCIVVHKSSRDSGIYATTYNYAYTMEHFAIGELDKDGDLVLDIIEREYSI